MFHRNLGGVLQHPGGAEPGPRRRGDGRRADAVARAPDGPHHDEANGSAVTIRCAVLGGVLERQESEAAWRHAGDKEVSGGAEFNRTTGVGRCEVVFYSCRELGPGKPLCNGNPQVGASSLRGGPKWYHGPPEYRYPAVPSACSAPCIQTSWLSCSPPMGTARTSSKPEEAAFNSLEANSAKNMHKFFGERSQQLSGKSRVQSEFTIWGSVHVRERT